MSLTRVLSATAVALSLAGCASGPQAQRLADGDGIVAHRLLQSPHQFYAKLLIAAPSGIAGCRRGICMSNEPCARRADHWGAVRGT